MLPLLAALLIVVHPDPDPAIMAKASREDKGGWIILHLAGSPRQVGYQHGALASTEIPDAIAAVKLVVQGHGKDWDWLRTTAHRLFWDKLDREYRQEIAGIAEGADAKGDTIDSDDILALNSYIEVMDYYLPVSDAKVLNQAATSRAPLACSAFVATGSETKDGNVVIGHNFWWDYLTGERWRVVLDIKPEKGRHLMMDALPGLIESGTDWAINDAGIAFCETTISGFVGFDPDGLPEFERMRKAIQYSGSLDDVARIFRSGNNGGYANTWLMADANTKMIGKLELGLKNVTFVVSKSGYYVGSNFPENPKLIAEETPDYSTGGNERRRDRWIAHMKASVGNVDDSLAESFLADTYNDNTKRNDGHGGGALCSKGGFSGAINAKVATAEDIKSMRFWGRMGIPDGSDLVGSKASTSLLHSLKGQAWTLVQAAP